MVLLTDSEKKALLVLVKEYTEQYNANSLSTVLGISHVGAQKLLKRLHDQRLITTRAFSHSKVHKPKLDEEYTCQLLTFLLADEANSHVRWKDEFKALNTHNRIVMIYGSALTDYQKARDVDIMVVTDNEHDAPLIRRELRKVEELLPKRLHALILTKEDLLRNLQQRNESMVDIIKNAVVIFGQEHYVEVMSHLAGF